MEQCGFCRKVLLSQHGDNCHVLPCGHISCSECYIKYNANGLTCVICSREANTDILHQPFMMNSATPYRPFMNQMSSSPPQQSPRVFPSIDAFGNYQQPQKTLINDRISNTPVFVPRDPHLFFNPYSPPQLKGSQHPIDLNNGGNASNTQALDLHFLDNYGPAKEEGLILEKNLNAVHVGLKARVSDVFGQIMRALSVQQETINTALDEKFANIGERLSGHDKDIDMPTDISAEVFKVTEEINAKLAEAKLMIDVINSLESKKTLSAFFDYLSSTNGNGGSPTTNGGSVDLNPIIDTTLSKPMIRSWSDSTSQAAVLITWTTPRDFELLHRSEGFWYELEQRLASEPESAWHNVYKGVERTFVCKEMHRGTKYLFRCCVCVARHRYSHWSPEVLIVPGTGLPDGKQNMVTPEISKALEQEVARNFTTGAVSAAGSSGPAVVTTVIVPINNNHNNLSSSSSTPVLPVGEPRSTSPATASLSPSPSPKTTAITTITSDPAQAASTIVSMSSSAAAVAAVVAAAQGGAAGEEEAGNSVVGSPPSSSLTQTMSMDVKQLRGKKQRNLPPAWTVFTPGPYYELSQSNKVATALQPGAIVLGQVFPKNCSITLSVRILRGSGIFIGIAPANINQSGIRQHLFNGWFLDTTTLSIGSHPPYRWKPKPAYPKGDPSKQHCVYIPHEGDLVTLNFNPKANCLRFSTIPGSYLPGKYSSFLSPNCRLTLVPAIVLNNPGDSVLFYSAVQGSI